MTNYDYWQTFVGTATPEEFLRSVGTADPELGLERFLEERGHFCGVVNQSTWESTFEATEQYHLLSVRVYLQSYLEETREAWQPALEAQPPKVVRRYRPVYDLPLPETSPESSVPDTAPGHDARVDTAHNEAAETEDVAANTSPEPVETTPADAVDEIVAAEPNSEEAIDEKSPDAAEVTAEVHEEQDTDRSDNRPESVEDDEPRDSRASESPAE